MQQDFKNNLCTVPQFKKNKAKASKKISKGNSKVIKVKAKAAKITNTNNSDMPCTSYNQKDYNISYNNDSDDISYPSYDQDEFENGCITSCTNVTQINCGKNKVTEGIGDHYEIEIDLEFSSKTDYKTKINSNSNKWEPDQPVFISAQTGSGKNYFIENTLIPYVKNLNYKHNTNHKILILSNRLALKRQINNRLNESDDSDEANEHIYHYTDTADVMTYQGILKRKGYFRNKQNGKERYLYVICDEAHFFTSDAIFNPDTEKILLSIVDLFKNAIRIYMSATPYECLKYIKEHETGCSIAFYHFKRDYSYLDVKSYDNIKDLYKQIVMSVNKKKKWLIFIDDKQKCASVKNQLGNVKK